ncbi:hypothetical protein MSG28_009437 [Choristoneura fumiferana]|uniref:Uncharacterized protein n=1 Tax=Choristoneura fumiferana TaxID=7141 RepID=A0ACC0KXD3_CHOFU|nr:hypothetical protein MSG28_009437 [Choristoneura fumiferana]
MLSGDGRNPSHASTSRAACSARRDGWQPRYCHGAAYIASEDINLSPGRDPRPDTRVPVAKPLTTVLRRNRISHVDERAFAAAPALQVLRLEENLLTEVPAAVQLLPALLDLSLGSNRVEWAGAGALRRNSRLARLDLRDNPCSRLHAHALRHLPALTTLCGWINAAYRDSYKILPSPHSQECGA